MEAGYNYNMIKEQKTTGGEMEKEKEIKEHKARVIKRLCNMMNESHTIGQLETVYKCIREAEAINDERILKFAA